MKYKLKILLILSFFFFPSSDALAQCVCTPTGYGDYYDAGHDCTSTYIEIAIFPDYASAVEARENDFAGYQASNPQAVRRDYSYLDSVPGFSTDPCAQGGTYGAVTTYIEDLDGTYCEAYYAYPYCIVGICSPPEICPGNGAPDTDQDGIPDDLDPYPNDASDLEWNPRINYYDPLTGDHVGILAEFADGHFELLGSEGFIADIDDGNIENYDSIVNVSLGDNYRDTDDYLELIGGFSAPDDVTLNRYMDDLSSGVGAFSQVDIVDDYQEGTGESQGNETDTELLQGILDNSSRQTNNQNSQGEDLRRIADGVELLAQNSILGEQNVDSGSGGYDGPNAGEIGGAVGNEMEALINDEASQNNALADGELGNINAYDFDSAIGDPAFDPETEVPEETLFSEVMDGFMASNPLSSVINGSGINLSNAVCEVSFDWSFGNQEHTTYLSMCEYEAQLQTWGTILLSLVGLGCVVMLVRG